MTTQLRCNCTIRLAWCSLCSVFWLACLDCQSCHFDTLCCDMFITLTICVLLSSYKHLHIHRLYNAVISLLALQGRLHMPWQVWAALHELVDEGKLVLVHPFRQAEFMHDGNCNQSWPLQIGLPSAASQGLAGAQLIVSCMHAWYVVRVPFHFICELESMDVCMASCSC